MPTYLLFLLIPIFSFLLAFAYYKSFVIYDQEKKENRDYKNAPLLWKFCQIWNQFVPMVVSNVILYYFIDVRWAKIVQEASVSFNDFMLATFFLIGITGLMPYLLTNITQGITAIVKKVLNN